MNAQFDYRANYERMMATRKIPAGRWFTELAPAIQEQK
jgi:hypothetical protein